mmetsp:Transcript_15955/g.44710  ORF Transcript_15955/g.44710 Transcript_15955/m.44710 type:complete len:800 (-) Transcript_15955:55-2454(-)
MDRRGKERSRSDSPSDEGDIAINNKDMENDTKSSGSEEHFRTFNLFDATEVVLGNDGDGSNENEDKNEHATIKKPRKTVGSDNTNNAGSIEKDSIVNANGDAKEQKRLRPNKQPSTDEESSARPSLTVRPFKGIISDLQARVPLYSSDWLQRPKSIVRVVNATCFAFVVQLIPALIFAELLNRKTEGSLAVPEVLLSAGIIGVIYAILSGQPLVLLGITGPVAILLGTSYGLAQDLNDADYFTFFWWMCMWTSLLHVLTACLGLVQFVWLITPFTSQIFEFFIAMSFIYESIRDLVEPIRLADDIDAPSLLLGGGRYLNDELSLSPSEPMSYHNRSSAYASLVIGLLTFQVCWTLHFAETWVYFTRQVRTFLASYNMMIALVVMTALSYLPGVDQDDGIERVHVRTTPWDWKPTAHRTEWMTVTNPFDPDMISTEGIFGALFPAVMLYLLFFIDHNISAILTQAPKYNLKKPPAYHWDFLILGITIIPCALMGLPPGSGLIPQAPLHTRALCSREKPSTATTTTTTAASPNASTSSSSQGKCEDDPKMMDETAQPQQHPDEAIREVFTHCEEQRWSALIQALLMFIALSLLEVVSWIPVGCLFGVFLYLGVGAMYGNEVWERITLCFMLPKKRPNIPIVTNVSSWRTVQIFTLVQVACAALIFGVAQFASVGYIFPALVAALVPFRIMVLPKIFSDSDMLYLDPTGETDEDYHKEQQEIVDVVRRRPSLDEAEMFHGFSELRTKNMAHDAKEYYHQHPDLPHPACLDEDEGGGNALDTVLPLSDTTNGMKRRHTIQSSM